MTSVAGPRELLATLADRAEALAGYVDRHSPPAYLGCQSEPIRLARQLREAIAAAREHLRECDAGALSVEPIRARLRAGMKVVDVMRSETLTIIIAEEER